MKQETRLHDEEANGQQAGLPTQPLAQSPLLTFSERHQQLVTWNQTAADYPRDRCIHHLVEAQVARTPDAIAIQFAEEQLSYRELNARANQLAHHLIRLGVKPEVNVGICLERSVAMMVSILGILKAGGVYVPLDPTYPQDRLAFLIADAAIGLVLTAGAITLPAYTGQLLHIEPNAAWLTPENRDNPTVPVIPDHLLYILYTSGSTGTPKGVAMPHAALCNLITWQCAQSTVAPRTLQFAPLSFDVSCQEIFSTWCAGGTLLLVDEETRREPKALLRLLQQAAVSRLFLPVVVLHQLAEAAQTESTLPITLREVITAGEQLYLTPALRHFFQRLPQTTLHNHYGPTETHVVTSFTLTGPVADWPALPPIGDPIANTQLYLLDDQYQPVPMGMVGELYVGGVAVARGYLNRPDLTAERFVKNPFGAGNLYKTGDQARRLATGEFVYLGRIDQQVKLRGFRVELGEIEAVLRQHPLVQDAAVVAQADTSASGDKKLIAYVVTQANPQPAVLRAYLANKLPDYMVPTAFVPLAALPLTTNGKVNRLALPAPTREHRVGDAYSAPRTPVEQQLAAIWCTLLGVEAVGVHDNFFALGGHSLLATQAVARIGQQFQVAFPLRRLFTSPTIAEMATIITQLRADRNEPTESAASERLPAEASPTPIIPRRKADHPLPLSFAQQRLWFLQQLHPDMTAYHETSAFWLRGPLQLAALHQSLNELIARHEVLRTTYVTYQEIPIQVINPPRPLALPLLDLCHIPLGQREAQLQQVAYAENRQPFDLTTDLMQRGKVLRFSPEEHVLLLTSHHIATDGWSISIFWRELAALYDAFTQGQPSPLPPLPLQYADYALWQRQMLQPGTPTARLEQLLRYWQTRLAGAPPLLELPLDFPRPSEQQALGKTWRFSIPLAHTEALKTLARQEEATLFMLLLAAFQVLLMRYTQQTDMVVGTPIAHRQPPEVEGLIGMFVNTLALRADLAGNPPFRTFLQQVRGLALAAYEHQDLPFEKLVEVFHPQRNLQYHPLVQVAFALQNTPNAALQLLGLQVTPASIAGETAKFDLYLSLTETANGLDGCLEYDTALFTAATIERMAGHYQSLLEGILTNPACPLAQLPLLTAAERHQLLVVWNQTVADFPRDRCIHHLVEEQVARTPDAIAIQFAGEQLSYRELNARANQLAHHLIRLGVKPEVNVGICLERSVAMVVGMLGILKAGGAYVPLDPTYPQDRLALMLADTAAPVLVTAQCFAPLFPHTQVKVVALDPPDHEITSQPSTNPQVALASSAPAYMIYTSGSTGIPKGVTIPHRAISRLLINTNYIDILNTDRIAQAANMAFDAATFEIWGALLHGATLVGISREVSLVPYQLAAYLREQEITILFLTTALFNQIARSVPDAFATLRVLLFGGESVDPATVRLVLRQGAPAQLLHVYGPTESTTFTTWHLVQSVADDAQTIPIGVPLANTQLYILDSQLQPVPIGIAGELYIGGDGLALGYHNRPDLTASKFLRVEFGADASPDRQTQPLYKTGDRVRYLSNGAVEFLGRIDDQVKIHGFRIEPGEIEAVLNQHPAVANSIVVTHVDQMGDKRLVAYVVPNKAEGGRMQDEKSRAAGDLGARSTLHTTLRDYLKTKLPDYMIPVAFVSLAQMPLTPTGKVDRRALPVPETNRLLQTEERVAPRSTVEKQLTELWKALLQLEQVGIHDNFFALGGHSLLTVQLIMQIKQQFAADLSLKHFWAGPTIAQLAAQIEQHKIEQHKIEQHKIEQQEGAPAQTTPANLAPLPHLPPALAQLYDTVGVPSALQDRIVWSGSRRWYLIHHALQRLPYRLRLPFVRHFTGSLTRNRLFQVQQQLITRFLASIETDVAPDQMIELSLRYGLLDSYQVNMIQPGKSALAYATGVQIEQARSQAKSVLLLLSHTTLQRWWQIPPIVQAHIGGVHLLTAQDDPHHAAITDMLFTRQVEYAHQILQQGGVAQIAADGQQGQGATLLYPFHGRRRPFMTGFAELALATGAQVIPLTYTIAPTGEAIYGLGSPLDPGAATLPQGVRVERLVSQYVARLGKMWSEAPWLVPWYQMERHLDYQTSRNTE